MFRQGEFEPGEYAQEERHPGRVELIVARPMESIATARVSAKYAWGFATQQILGVCVQPDSRSRAGRRRSWLCGY